MLMAVELVLAGSPCLALLLSRQLRMLLLRWAFLVGACLLQWWRSCHGLLLQQCWRAAVLWSSGVVVLVVWYQADLVSSSAVLGKAGTRQGWYQAKREPRYHAGLAKHGIKQAGHVVELWLCARD